MSAADDDPIPDPGSASGAPHVGVGRETPTGAGAARADGAAPRSRGDVLVVARRYVLVVLWGTLPFVAGPAFAAALDPRSRAVQVVASAGLWLAWVVALAAALVPRTISL